MKKILLILLTARLLAAALGSVNLSALPENAETPPELPAETVERENPELGDVLDRIAREYDPDAAGSVGAIRWAEKLLEAYTDSASAEEAARRCRETYPEADLAGAIARLRTAAEALASGQDLGLVRDPAHRRGGWTADTVSELFDALERGIE